MTKKLLLILALLLSFLSCKKEIKKRQPPKPPQVHTITATVEKIKEKKILIGQTKPHTDIDFITKVEGYITDVGFRDGGPVYKGDLLFQIDKRPYQVKVDQAQAKVYQAKASEVEAEKKYKRMKILFEKKAISEQDKDTAEANFEAAKATVSAAKAELDYANLNLGYTEIKAPIDGKMAIGHISKGNYVTPQSGPLGQLVSIKPMYVDVNISEKLVITILQENLLEGENLLDIKKEQKWDYSLILSNGDDYKYTGEIDSFDNKVNPTTGTIKVRFEFPNKNSLLSPNQYVKLVLTQKVADDKLVIPQSAVMADQTGEYVYTLNAAGIVQRKSVLTADRLGDKVSLKEAPKEGLFLEEGEQVIFQGTQKARPGSPATAKVSPNSKNKEE